MKIKIDVYSHHFVVRDPDHETKRVLYGIASDFTTFKTIYDRASKKQKWVPDKTYAIHVGFGEEFRFHIGQLYLLMEYFKKNLLNVNKYDITYHDPLPGVETDLKIQSQWSLYPDQIKAMKFALSSYDMRISHRIDGAQAPLLSMPTGTGKTVTSSFVCSKIGQRLCVFVLSRFVDKWISDVKDIYDVKDKDICVISGGKALVNASHWEQNDPDYPMPKIFIISINTMDVWINAYCAGKRGVKPNTIAYSNNKNNADNRFVEAEKNYDLEKYGCEPYELMEKLGIGVVLIDEAHMHLYMTFRVFCFLHVPFVLSLSATMRNKNVIIQRVQRTMFPRSIRFEEIKMKEYIKCRACAYQIMNFASSKVKINEHGKTSYSHNAFERSIMSHKTLGPQYIKMIVDLVINTHHADYMPGDKCLIFVAKKETALIIRNAIRSALPQYVTNTYLQEDPLEQLMSSDISVSTVLSAGTALDIPNLRNAILTISIDSEQANLQALGRLRELKDRDVSFWYLYCASIQKHIDYHRNKKDLFRGRVLSHEDIVLSSLH